MARYTYKKLKKDVEVANQDLKDQGVALEYVAAQRNNYTAVDFRRGDDVGKSGACSTDNLEIGSPIQCFNRMLEHKDASMREHRNHQAQNEKWQLTIGKPYTEETSLDLIEGRFEPLMLSVFSSQFGAQVAARDYLAKLLGVSKGSLAEPREIEAVAEVQDGKLYLQITKLTMVDGVLTWPV